MSLSTPAPFAWESSPSGAIDLQVTAAACAVRPPLHRLPAHRAHRGRRFTGAILRRRQCRSEHVLAYSCSQAVPCPPNGVSGRVSSLPSVGCGKSQCSPTESNAVSVEQFSFFLINLRGFVSHSAELVATIEELGFPTFVCLNETLLPGERAMPTIVLEGYSVVSRLDRRDNSGWGGIALFAKNGYEQCIVHVGDSEVTERSWHILHTDRGPMAVALWYRRPDPGEVSSIKSLEVEIPRFATDTVGTIVLGDLNVHEPAWLRYSAGTTLEGRELHGFCSERGLHQYVREPTRGDYLLDLAISDLGPLMRVKVVAGIADHSGVLCTVTCPVPEAVTVQRTVLLYGRAKWMELRRAIANHDWSSDILPGDADGSAERFEERLLHFMHLYIPHKTISEEKSAHQWLDDACRRLIREKRSAWGTASYAGKRDACTSGLLEAYSAFVRRTKAKLSSLKPSSREWWKISKSLMSLGGSAEVIPPLKHNDGTWATSASDKANLLAETFANKSRNDPAVNVFSELQGPSDVSQGNGFLPIRKRYVRRVLTGLDEHSGTGPDGISSRILRQCRDALELPVLLLARVIVNQGRWPRTWRMHWVHPLYKKKSRADSRNYRGVHLTPQISKVIERVVGCAFLPWANKVRLFCENQYAYSTRRSHRDALAVNISNWLRFLDDGYAVGLYCSDVSGAFDRVRCERLVEKLRRSGLHPNIVLFLESWLEDRMSMVVVSGAMSDSTVLANSVFQGTVLGRRCGIFSTLTLPSQQGFFASLKSFLQTTLTAGSPSQVARLETKFCVNVALAKLDSTNGAQQILSNLIRQKNPSMCCIAQTVLGRISNC